MTQIPAEKPAASQRSARSATCIGWLVLDKPVGMTSTHAVSVVKRLFKARRAGHAGTLDPLASGLLPIALGEATKTVPFVMDGRKRYRFTVRWGEERDTDDAEGRVTETSAERPTAEAIRALLPRFTGTIAQVPPRFSAVKIDGERAYDLAREGEVVELAPRPVEIHRLELVETPDSDHTRARGRMRQGNLCARARPRHGPRARLFRPCRGAAPHRGRPVRRRERHRLEALQRIGSPMTTGSHAAALLPVAAGLAALPALRVSRPMPPGLPAGRRCCCAGATRRSWRAGSRSRPGRAGRAGRGREGRTAPAADFQLAAGLARSLHRAVCRANPGRMCAPLRYPGEESVQKAGKGGSCRSRPQDWHRPPAISAGVHGSFGILRRCAA